jgi:hypothetical protein
MGLKFGALTLALQSGLQSRGSRLSYFNVLFGANRLLLNALHKNILVHIHFFSYYLDHQQGHFDATWDYTLGTHIPSYPLEDII